MSLIRYAAIIAAAATLAACGGAPADTVPTLDPRADALTLDASSEAPTQAAPPQADAPAVALADAPEPASLEEGTFAVNVEIEQGTVVLTPVPPIDEDTDYVVGDYDPADEFTNTSSIAFMLYERRNDIWTYSQVQLRLPEGAGPGTYDIEANALLMEEGKVAAYVDNFTDNDLTEYVFYDDFEGTITITEIDDEVVSGNFAFIGRDPDGHVANVSGAFNGIGDSMMWLNQGHY